MTIRPHHLADATAIADVLADGWKAAYSNFMPPDILNPRIDRTVAGRMPRHARCTGRGQAPLPICAEAGS